MARTLSASGWLLEPRGGADRTGTVAAFSRGGGADFEVTAHVVGLIGPRNRAPLRVAELVVGLSYVPLRELWNVWGGPERFGDVVVSRRPRSLFGHGGKSSATDDAKWQLDTEDDVPVVAGRLAAIVQAQADMLLSSYSSVGAILEYHRERDARPRYGGRFVVAALLATTGRLAEARAEFAASALPDPKERDAQQYRRFAKLFERWLDAGPGRRRSLEEPAIAWRLVRPPGPSTSLRGFMRSSRARDREAVRAIRRQRQGRTRDELRPLLERELLTRGASAKAAHVELLLDEASTGPFRRANSRLRRLPFVWLVSLPMIVAVLVRYAVWIVRVVRRTADPAPEWLEPPEDASYPGPKNPDLTVFVERDDGIERYLKRAMRASPQSFGRLGAVLDCWLDWDPDPHQDASQIAVYLGARRVGVIRPDTRERYAIVMTAAELRGELPCFRGCTLSRRPRRHGTTLEIPCPLPAPGTPLPSR
jgi:hypothetical protein